jgi:integrase
MGLGIKEKALLQVPAPKDGHTIKWRGKAILVQKRKHLPNRALTKAQIRLLLSSLDNIRDALMHPGLPVGLRVSEVVSIRTSEIDLERGFVITTNEAMSAIRKYLNHLLPLEPCRFCVIL